MAVTTVKAEQSHPREFLTAAGSPGWCRPGQRGGLPAVPLKPRAGRGSQPKQLTW